jgi:hypothetical protein
MSSLSRGVPDHDAALSSATVPAPATSLDTAEVSTHAPGPVSNRTTLLTMDVATVTLSISDSVQMPVPLQFPTATMLVSVPVAAGLISAPLTGIHNDANMCGFVALLQCLFSIPLLVQSLEEHVRTYKAASAAIDAAGCADDTVVDLSGDVDTVTVVQVTPRCHGSTKGCILCLMHALHVWLRGHSCSICCKQQCEQAYSTQT